MRTALLATLLLVPALLAGRPVQEADWVSLSRGPCFGNCPIYEVVLRADGSASYTGGDYAPRTGEYVGRVDPGAVERLLDRLHEVGFWEMKLDRQLRVMDLPEAVLRARDGDRRHRVHSNLTPRELEPIHAAIDSIAGEIDWTPAREAPPPRETR